MFSLDGMVASKTRKTRFSRACSRWHRGAGVEGGEGGLFALAGRGDPQRAGVEGGRGGFSHTQTAGRGDPQRATRKGPGLRGGGGAFHTWGGTWGGTRHRPGRGFPGRPGRFPGTYGFSRKRKSRVTRGEKREKGKANMDELGKSCEITGSPGKSRFSCF